MSSDTKPPAYLVVCGKFLSGDGAEEYAKRAAKPATESGLTPIARGDLSRNVEILEGELPFDGFLAIERFDSMDALKGFWYSDEYQSAIPNGKDAVKMHFVAAVDGIAES